MSIDQILEDIRRWKEFGASPKFPIHIATLEKLCHDAKAWQSTPQVIRDAAKAVGQ